MICADLGLNWSCAGMATAPFAMGWVGNGLGCPWAKITMGWFGHGGRLAIDWPLPELAMGWAEYGLG
jgi:hypothetical protein